ncbi:MAG TPA: ABC transporter [Flavobacteriales bacterium]|nr:ABC transporter [Flavobacteriales bacterium]
MRELWKLNSLIKRYPQLLLGGVVFIFLTNVFAVYAPSLIGEGVNALKDMDSAVLEPLREGAKEEALFSEPIRMDLPPSLRWISSVFAPDAEISLIASKDNALAWMKQLALWQAGLFLLAYLIKGIFLFFTRQTIIVMSRRIEFDLKGKIFDQYQRLDASFYKANDTGDLMNRISEDVSKVRMYLGPAIMYTLNLTMLIFLVVGVMVYIDWQLTLFALLPLPLMSVGIYLVSTRINRQSEAVQRQQSGLSTFVQQHIAGIRVLKSFQREHDATERFTEAADLYKMNALKLVKTEALFMPIIVMLVGLSTILTIYVGGQRVIAGELEIGHVFQFVFYVNLLTWPFASVGWVTSLVQKAEASMKRINAFMEATPVIQSAPSETAYSADKLEEITFDKVSFTYPETGIVAAKDVSFTIKPGQIVAITGRTGSGKSTLAQLAMRIFDPESGEIRINGKSLPEWNLTSFRSLCGYVPQDVFLFSDTIQNNIAFGIEGGDASLDDVKAAALEAHVAHNIEGFQKGYQTLLGERGVNLSGGQKQRISIARAFIRRPQLLILDDCLSAVDTETEETILNSIRKQGKESAVLLVSHRISSIRGADHVLVLDAGQVVESGHPNELASAGGPYARMVEQQSQQGEDGKEENGEDR